jgi:thiosulfate/3-mercaptopyruvate sulfurtransferase
MLVDAAWLTAHQRDPDLVLLHVGPRASYDSAHIAGARYVESRMIVADRPGGPVYEIPEPAALDSVLESLGISDNSRVVVYQSDQWFSPSTRLLFTLHWAGLGDRVSWLDGGLAAWRRGGGAVTAAAPEVRRGTLTLRPRTDLVVTADWLAARLGDQRIALIDARNERFFLGNYEASEDRGDPRPGRIPGAYNVPFNTMVDSTGMLLPPARLREVFGSVRADAGDTVITYCHIGQQGTLVWFAARIAGYEARLYDGSFTYWSRQARLPVERP